MSIFGDILRKIFPSHHPAVTSAPAPAPAAHAPAAPAPAPTAAASAPSSTATPAKPAGARGSPPPATPAAAPVDVQAVLSAMAEKNSQQLNWRSSIVDLMKLLDLDSSLAARQGLAKELGYSGDMNDSATMNIWLHKQVMTRLAENGGKVPEDLRH